MKDAYSFDLDAQGLDRNYQVMYEAYQRIFARCGVKALACEADSGVMGGSQSHEFMAPSDSGEDRVALCEACGYAANLEAARCDGAASVAPMAELPKSMETVRTPGQHTVEQVSRFLGVLPSKLIKTLLYDADGQPMAVLVRGDHEVNEAKLARAAGSSNLKLAGSQTIERLTGAPVGFTGPVQLRGVRLLADHAAMQVANAVTGANQAEAHHINVNPGRDFTPDAVADVRFITAEDGCPKCGGRIALVNTIEAGHVFKLGTKYSQALGATVQHQDGVVRPMVMGCYGIGVNRILACAIEQGHDSAGIIWPVALAPMQVVISMMESGNADLSRAAEALYGALRASGLEVLLDDREQSPGSKLKDADLIGLPVQVVIGKVWLRERKLELRRRATKEQLLVDEAVCVETIHKLLDTSPSVQ